MQFLPTFTNLNYLLFNKNFDESIFIKIYVDADLDFLTLYSFFFFIQVMKWLIWHYSDCWCYSTFSHWTRTELCSPSFTVYLFLFVFIYIPLYSLPIALRSLAHRNTLVLTLFSISSPLFGAYGNSKNSLCHLMGLIILYWCQPYTFLRYPMWEWMLQNDRAWLLKCLRICVCVFVFPTGKQGISGLLTTRVLFCRSLSHPGGTLCCWEVQLDARGTGDTWLYPLFLAASHFDPLLSHPLPRSIIYFPL